MFRSTYVDVIDKISVNNMKRPKILTRHQHIILETPQILDTYRKQSKSAFYVRVNKSIDKAMTELINIAERLPYKYRKRAFKSQAITEFLDNILKPEIDNHVSNEFVNNVVLFKLCMDIAKKALLNARRLYTMKYEQLLAERQYGVGFGFFPSDKDLRSLSMILAFIKTQETES